jgi:hypothetical protein
MIWPSLSGITPGKIILQARQIPPSGTDGIFMEYLSNKTRLPIHSAENTSVFGLNTLF